jgi:uncharacterized protein YegJ (DUF2314 family)
VRPVTSRCLLIALLTLCSLAAVGAATSEFEALEKEAGRDFSTKEGQRYLEEFQKAIMPIFGNALNDCKERPDTKEPATFLFVVAADGKVKRLLYSRDIPFGVCVASKLRAIKTLPKPPRDSWIVAFGAANHHHEEQARANAPPDKLVSSHGEEQVDAYDRAIAPYVAKARASYPSAKKRYLAGLPPGYTFAVWIRLYQNDEKTRENRHEDVFVVVEQIKNGTIYGWINNKLDLLTNYQKGERIQFPESDVKSWVIVRPDGSEEGNDVGKFLEHWTPPKA